MNNYTKYCKDEKYKDEDFSFNINSQEGEEDCIISGNELCIGCFFMEECTQKVMDIVSKEYGIHTEGIIHEEQTIN